MVTKASRFILVNFILVNSISSRLFWGEVFDVEIAADSSSTCFNLLALQILALRGKDLNEFAQLKITCILETPAAKQSCLFNGFELHQNLREANSWRGSSINPAKARDRFEG